MFLHLSFNCVLLLLLLLLLTGSSEAAYLVEVGKNAYLPCSYVPSSGTLVPVCWGRGPCPWSQCANLVLSTDERNVTYQKSSRYQLKGNVHKGDVSLTIENVTLVDHGTYCCRVQHPGPMNDDKFNLELVIQPAKVTPTGTTQGDFTTALPGTFTTEGKGSETQTLGNLHEKNQTQIPTLADELKDSGEDTGSGVYIIAGVSAGLALALGLLFSALILKWYSQKKKKSQSSSLITLANLPSVGLANAAADRMRSVENVYTIEENIYEVENSNEYYCYVSSGQPS